MKLTVQKLFSGEGKNKDSRRQAQNGGSTGQYIKGE